MIARLLRTKTFRLAAGLTLAIAVPVSILLFFQYRSLGDLERTSAVVLEALSSQTAGSLAQGMQADFRGPRYELAALRDEWVEERFDIGSLAGTMATLGRSDVKIESFYAWSEHATGQFAGRVLEFSTSPPSIDSVDPIDRFKPAGSESTIILDIAHNMMRRGLALGIETVELNGHEQVLVVRPRFDAVSRNHLRGLVGFRIDLNRLRSEYVPKAFGARLAEANRHAGLAPLVASVLDDQGRVVYQSAPSDPAHFLDEKRVPLMFFDSDSLSLLRDVPWRDRPPAEWVVRTGYGSQSVATIAHASTASHRAQLAILIILTFGGIFFGTRAAVQEVRLAELKSNFVASVSHELKTPLALIQLFAETLELGRVRTLDRAKEYYGIINAEARKLAGLIDNILDLSRLESGFEPYKLEPVNLSDIIRSTLSDFEPQFQHNQFAVTVTLDRAPLIVLADAEAVGVALRNLLSNALKYSAAQRVIAVESRGADGYAHVRIKDRGRGIPVREHRKIFQKFYRVESASDDRPSGTGLGLAIVEQVMRAHGGRVRVDSEPGRGSVFTLTFPLAKEQPVVHETDSRDRRRAPDAAGAA